MSTTKLYSVITGSGSYIPPKIVANSAFANHLFLNEDGTPIDTTTEEIIQKFEQITDISESRIAEDKYNTSD
jgi:3-oxoacyl-[acyl-carrier-protein] synthase-3